MPTPLKIQIIVDDKGSVKIRQVGTESEKAGKKGETAFRRTGKSLDEMNRKAATGHSRLLKLAGAAVSLGALYLAFRQGDHHADPQGKILVLRSRDDGVTFDHVAVLRGEHDTRDSHLYASDGRLRLVGFEYDYQAGKIISGD